MKLFHSDPRLPVVITTRHSPLLTLGYVFGALACIVLLYAASMHLDEAAADTDQRVADAVQYASGLEEGRRQAREDMLQAVRAAYQHGLQEAATRCGAQGATK